MEHFKQEQPIKTKENQVTPERSEIKIKKNLYLVTSHYSGTQSLEDTLLHAINREAMDGATHKTDEKPSRKGYNGNSNIYSR